MKNSNNDCSSPSIRRAQMEAVLAYKPVEKSSGLVAGDFNVGEQSGVDASPVGNKSAGNPKGLDHMDLIIVGHEEGHKLAFDKDALIGDNAFAQPKGDEVVFGLPGVEAHEDEHCRLDNDSVRMLPVVAHLSAHDRFEDVRGLGDEGMADLRAAIQNAQNVIKVN